MTIATLLTPAELPALAHRDLRRSACVVFDILRATSTFVTALHQGATAIIPVREISEAEALRRSLPEALLAGERNGVKIRAMQPGEIDFNLGNSPREFTADIVRGKAIVSTTTNGTRSLRACRDAQTVLAGSFLNLAATASFLQRLGAPEILLVCAGTGEGVALEDVLAAGALAEMLVAVAASAPARSDATEIARQTWLQMNDNLPAALGSSQNGRRLLAMPELRDDVAFCAQLNVFPQAVVMDAHGWLRLAN